MRHQVGHGFIFQGYIQDQGWPGFQEPVQGGCAESADHGHGFDDLRRIVANAGPAHERGARNLRVFGSVARGEANESSDLDLLVDIVGSTTDWWPGGIIVDLEELLGIRVDVATLDGLRPRIRQEALKDAIPL